MLAKVGAHCGGVSSCIPGTRLAYREFRTVEQKFPPVQLLPPPGQRPAPSRKFYLETARAAAPGCIYTALTDCRYDNGRRAIPAIGSVAAIAEYFDHRDDVNGANE